MFERWKHQEAIRRHLEELRPRLLERHGRGPYAPAHVRAVLAEAEADEAWSIYAFVLFCDEDVVRRDASLAPHADWDELFAETRLVRAELEAAGAAPDLDVVLDGDVAGLDLDADG